MSDRITSYLRTAVPVAWGWLLTQLVLVLPGTPAYVVDALSTTEVITAVTAGVTLLWYAVWRRVEPHVPDWLSRIALGSALTPAYRLGSVYPIATYNTDDKVMLTDGAVVTIGSVIMNPHAEAASYEVYYASGAQGLAHEPDIARRVSRAQ